MFLIRLLRFFKGYVIFTCSGGFPERFINLCSQNGINLWDAKSTGGVLTAKTFASAYRHIRPCAKKSGMKIKIKEKCGFPFIIRPYLKRKGITAGVILSAVLLIYLSSCIWTVSVSGNEKFTSAQIISLAEKYGVYTGNFRKNIDIKATQEAIKATVDSISWFSVNINGSAVSIELTEAVGSNEIIDSTEPCNIISDADGELISLEAYVGTPAVKTGSAVSKGTLLISGVKERENGTAEFVHARGTATVRTREDISVTAGNNIKAVKFSDIKKRRHIYIFGLDIPLGFGSDAGFTVTRNAMLEFRNRILPVGIITDTYFLTEEATLQLNESRQQLLACFCAFRNEKTIMKNTVTESKTAEISADRQNVTVSVSYINHKTTGIENFFEVSEDSN